ncbi:MAG: GNAT family N-acetyltransferase [Vulcanimicrobiaceae bacterium]
MGWARRRPLSKNRARVRIEPMRVEDIDTVLELFEAVAAERRYIGTEPGFDRAVYRARLAARVDDRQRPSFVARIDGRLIGHLSISQHHEFGPTLGMMVAAEYRGRGVGRALLQQACAWATAAGRQLSLLVFPHNHAARGLYRSMGFLEVERFERNAVRANGEVWDTILMRKTFS